MTDTPTVEFKIVNPLLNKLGGLPDYQTAGAAGMDLRACIDEKVIIKPGEVKKIDLGFAVYMKSRNLACILLPRGGQGSRGLVLANTIGLIDSDYTGEFVANMMNRTQDQTFEINPGDRICQMMFVPVVIPQMQVVEEFSETTERGSGRFTSTGVK